MDDIDKNLDLSFSKESMTRYSESCNHSYSASKRSKDCCHICQALFTLKRRKKICIRCEQPVCKQDSGGEVKEKQRVCNVCRREEMNDRIREEYESKRVEKYQTLQGKLEEGKNLEESLKKLSKGLKKIDRRIEVTSSAYASSCEQLETSIKIQTEISQSLAQEIQDLENIQANEAIWEEQKELTNKQMTRQIEELTADCDQLDHENNTQRNNIEDLIASLKQLLNLRELKSMLCKKCYFLIRKETIAAIKAKAHRKSLPEETLKDKTCGSCLIF